MLILVLNQGGYVDLDPPNEKTTPYRPPAMTNRTIAMAEAAINGLAYLDNIPIGRNLII